MTTVRKVSVENESQPALKLIKGGLYQTDKKRKRINDFWVFCHSAFWSAQNFTEAEEQQFRTLIAAHFAKCNDINKRFKELVERATLAKRYVQRYPNRYMQTPTDWLNITNANGLTGTAIWFSQVKQKRKANPEHHKGIAHLSKAILSYSKRRNVLDVANYRHAFIEMKEHDLLLLYTNAVMHLHFINL